MRTRKNRYKRPLTSGSWVSFLTRNLQADIGYRLLHGSFLLLFLVLLSLLLLLGHDILTQMAFFRLNQATITGGDHLTPAEVETAAGLDRHPNILALNSRLLQARLLAHPWIAAADIKRQWPNVLHVHIVEQVPLAVMEFETREMEPAVQLILNSQGELFKAYHADDPTDLPLIRGMRVRDFPIQSGLLSQTSQAIMTLFEILNRPEASIQPDMLALIEVDADLGLALTFKPNPKMPNAARVILGFEQYPQKLQLLQRVLDYLQDRKRGLQWIDLHNPTRLSARME